MMQERIKAILSPTSRQTIATSLMNFVSTIPDDEEIEISFEQNDHDGKSHIYLDAIRNSKTPNIERSVKLTDKTLDVKVGASANGKSATKAE